MNLYDATADTLRYGIIVSMVIVVLGLAADWSGYGENILWFGILVLILTPLFGVIVSLLCLVFEKDMLWAKAAAILLSVITAGIAVAIYIS